MPKNPGYQRHYRNSVIIIYQYNVPIDIGSSFSDATTTVYITYMEFYRGATELERRNFRLSNSVRRFTLQISGAVFQWWISLHYHDVMMGAMAPQITSPAIDYWSIYSGTDQRKHQSSVSLAFVWGIHRWPVNSPHKGPVTRKMFPFDEVIMRGWSQVRGAIF